MITTDNVVDQLAEAFAANDRLRTLCQSALRRTSQSHVLQHLTAALNVLGLALQRRAENPLEKVIAWMLRGYKAAIAGHLYDLLDLGRDDHVLLSSSIDQDAIARHVLQEQRMKHFMKATQPWIEQHEHGVFQIIDIPQDHVRLEASDMDDKLGRPPDLAPFAAFSNVEHLFSSGPAFELVYRKLKNAFFPPAFETIEKVLRKHRIISGESASVMITVEWQLLEYFGIEATTPDDLESIFTVTGEFASAKAFRLSDYLTGLWNTGSELLSVIKTLLGNFLAIGPERIKESSVTASGHGIEILVFPALHVSREEAYIRLSGSAEQIHERIQQLAWLTAVLRPHREGQLTTSDIVFRAQQVLVANSMKSFSNLTAFHLSLCSQETVLQPDSSVPGQCWTSAFPESVLAYGFPIPGADRPEEALGLEAPFEIVAALVGVKYPVLLKNRILFAGNSSVLVPEMKIGENCIQWHFQKSDYLMEKVIAERSKKWDMRLETLNISSLTTSRAFLGYCRHAETLLGTVEYKYVDIADSGLPTTSKAAFQSPEKPIAIDIDARGSGIAADTTRWKFNRGETALIHTTQHTLAERLRHIARTPTLLYDQNSNTAFLVSSLSVLLQSTIFHLWKESTLKRNDIPTAGISAKGSEAAYQAIIKAKHLTVPLTNGLTRRYVDIVNSFIDTMEQRRLQTTLWRHYETTISYTSLKGWDHSDLLTQSYQVFERELRLPLPQAQPTWWKLFHDPAAALVLFTRLPKPPLRNSATDSSSDAFTCRAWNSLPENAHLLLAATTQLDLLKNTLCLNPRAHPTRYMLSDTVAWVRPLKSRLFENSCRPGGSCNPMQTMVEVDTIQDPRRTGDTTQHGDVQDISVREMEMDMALEGAVLFAEDPGDFGVRPCWAQARPKVSSRADRNYLFFGAVVVGFALVWWNFYFFVFSLAVFGLAYVLSS